MTLNDFQKWSKDYLSHIKNMDLNTITDNTVNAFYSYVSKLIENDMKGTLVDMCPNCMNERIYDTDGTLNRFCSNCGKRL